MKKTKYSKELENFLNFLRRCEADAKSSAEEEKLMEMQTQDILHHVELKRVLPFDYFRLCVALGSIRRKRRKAKDMRMALAPIVEWINANRKVIDSLTQVLGRVRKEEKAAMKQRYYIDRTDIIKQVLTDYDE